jgi:hypothetical protein
MFDDFMSDDILNEKEYSMLLQFLNSIRSTISKEAYDKLKGQIDDTYSISLAKSKLDNKK